MKKLYLSVVLAIATLTLFAQSNKAVNWSFEAKKLTDNSYEVHMVANVSGNYHIYAQNAGEGPVSTSFDFTKNPLLAFDGKVKEVGQMKKVHEEAFGSDVKYYEKKVEFVQVVKVKGKAKTSLAGKVEFMVCNDKECLPPSTVNFKVAIGG